MKPFSAIFPGLMIGLILLAGIETPAASSSGGAAIRCDIDRGPCQTIMADGVKLAFEIQPRPVTAMTGLTFIVALSRNGAPLSDASVALDLTMPGMFMGTNRPVLRHIGEGRFEGAGVITRCSSGRKTWQARVTVTRNGQAGPVDFLFDLNHH